MTSPAPSLAALDATLARLHGAAATVNGRLLDLDNDPVRALLANGPLAGTTAARWAPASAALDRLWHGRDLLQQLLGQADTVRGTGGKLGKDEQRELDRLLSTAAIQLSVTSVPDAQQSLLGPNEVVRRCTADELLRGMSDDYAAVRDVVGQVAAVWGPLADRLATLAAGVTGVAAAAGSGAALAQRFDAARTAATQDPLGFDRGVLDDLDRDLVRARAALTSAEELAAAVRERLTRARTALGGVQQAEERAAAANARTAVALVGTPPVAVPRLAGLRGELASLEALAAAGHVASLLPRLTALEKALREAGDAAMAGARRDEAALAERNELRGRLDAYQAMALRRGLGEDPELGRLSQAARTLLMTAPCVLADARAAVGAYQAELSARQQRKAG